MLRKISNQISQSEERIEQLEAEMDVIEKKLSDPSKHQEIQKLYARHDQIKLELEAEMKKWENLNIELERFKEQRN